MWTVYINDLPTVVLNTAATVDHSFADAINQNPQLSNRVAATYNDGRITIENLLLETLRIRFEADPWIGAPFIVTGNPTATIPVLTSSGGLTFTVCLSPAQPAFVVTPIVAKSAYEIATDQGFQGTIQEWLDSLIGPQGEPADPAMLDDLQAQIREIYDAGGGSASGLLPDETAARIAGDAAMAEQIANKANQAALDALYVAVPPTLPEHTLYHATLQDGQLVWDGTLTTFTTGETQQQAALAALCVPLPAAGQPYIKLSVAGYDPASGLTVEAVLASQGTDPVPVLMGGKIADLYVPESPSASLSLTLSSDAVDQTLITTSGTLDLQVPAPAGSVVWIMLYTEGPAESMATPVTLDGVSQSTGIVAELQTALQALTDRVDQGAMVFSAGVMPLDGYVGVHDIPALDLVDGAVWRLSGAGLVSALTEARALNPVLRLTRLDGGVNEQADGVADAASTLDRVVSWQGFLCVQAGKIKLSVQITINDQAQVLYAECALFTDSGVEISVIAAGGHYASQTTQIASVLEKLK